MYELFTQISIFSVLTKVFSKGWVLTWVLVLNLVRCVAEIHGYVLGNIDESSCADYNQDGNIDILDIVSVVSLILGN